MALERVDFDTTNDEGGGEGGEGGGGEELILGKFKTQDDLVKAYQALEQKQGGGDAKPVDDDKGGKPRIQIQHSSNNDMLDEQALISEYNENDGKLSDKTYKALERKGLSRNMVDNYVRGQMAVANEYAAAITQAAGGQANLDGLLEWAGANLEQSEIDDINAIFNGNNLTAAKYAVAGLVQRRAEAGEDDGDSDPNLLEGDTNTKALGVKPYDNRSQMINDMMSKEYKTDPAFREKVAKRASVSRW